MLEVFDGLRLTKCRDEDEEVLVCRDLRPIYILISSHPRLDSLSCTQAWPDSLDDQDPVTVQEGVRPDLCGVATWRDVQQRCPWGENGVLLLKTANEFKARRQASSRGKTLQRLFLCFPPSSSLELDEARAFWRHRSFFWRFRPNTSQLPRCTRPQPPSLKGSSTHRIYRFSAQLNGVLLEAQSCASRQLAAFVGR